MRTTAFLLASCAIAVMGCGEISDRALDASLPALSSKPAAAAPSATPTPPVRCGDPTLSLRPPAHQPTPGRMPRDSFMHTIQERGRLIVGVDQNTLRFGYRDPFTGELEGFEIDLLREVARDLLGDPDAIQTKVLTSATRFDAVRERRVDIVASAATITCARRRLVAFTTPYYEAGQRLLVPSTSTVTGLRDLDGKKVCATVGSTSIENLRAANPRAIPYPVAQRTDCLVALQRGLVDAVTSDDAILLGFQAQDPYTKIVGPRFSKEPYGMAIHRSHPEFVRFVNGVLARMRADGTWSSLNKRWLGELAQKPPAARYRDAP